jgi:hypothetical protein
MIDISGVIRGIIIFPFRMMGYMMGIPNFKLIYKSGHVEKVFLKAISRDGGGEWEWTTATGSCKSIVIIGVDEVVAVYMLY